MKRHTPRSVYFYGPRSFFTLILISFGFVALPLGAALIYASTYVDRLTAQSQSAVQQAVQTTQNSRQIMEQLTGMERNARQYQILGDPALFEAYTEKRVQLRQVADELATLAADAELQEGVQTLLRREQALFATLKEESAAIDQQATASAFSTLTDNARTVLDQSHQAINERVSQMQRATDNALQTLIWLSAALVPSALIFTVMFAILINRPIKQIDRAIRQLGDGTFSRGIQVSGPRDLEYLGQRLDWLRQRLGELEAQKVLFIRHVSHELKTPLTALREGTELLDEEVVGRLTPQQQEVTKILRENGRRLQRLIEDLLDFQSLANNARPVLSVSSVALHQVAAAVATDHKLTVLAKDITLTTDLAPVELEGDEWRLRTVVDNLLSNAIKYSPPGSEVQLRLRQEEGEAQLDVYDGGPGIPKEEAEKVFDAFYQGATYQAEGHIKGTGLGLFLAREYVQAHGGDIEVVRDGPGGHLRVTLPLRQASADAESADAA